MREPPAYLGKAQEALKSARILMEQGCSNSVANRAYYATFQAARAALVAAGEGTTAERWSHDGVQSRFSQLIHRRKLYPSHLRRYLSELITAREFADYGVEMISLRVAKDALRMAEEFLALVEKRIAP